MDCSVFRIPSVLCCLKVSKFTEVSASGTTAAVCFLRRHRTAAPRTTNGEMEDDDLYGDLDTSADALKIKGVSTYAGFLSKSVCFYLQIRTGEWKRCSASAYLVELI